MQEVQICKEELKNMDKKEQRKPKGNKMFLQ